MRNCLLILTVVIFITVLPKFCLGSIQIDSVKTTASTCPNNGSITVYATSSSLPVFYSIISGPITQPVQTGNFFNSLPAGTYTIRVSNGALETATQDVTIAGNYQLPDFAALTTDPRCAGGSDGQIIGNLTPNTGNGPYTWQLIAPSPVTAPPQASDTFNNLVAGNYTVRVTDACGSFRTIVATLTDPPTANLQFINSPAVTIMGCDSAIATFYMQSNDLRLPLTCTYETSAGSFTSTDLMLLDTISYCCGTFTFTTLLPGVGYGDYIRLTVTDSCGNTIQSPLWTVQPFYFCQSPFASFKDCVYSTVVAFDIDLWTCIGFNAAYTFVMAPLIYEIRDDITNQVVDSDTLYGGPGNHGYNMVSGFLVDSIPTNKNYTAFIKDGCGNTFTQPFYFPDLVPLPPAITYKLTYPNTCVDSTTQGGITCENFQSQPEIIFLSGPGGAGSTKPGYEYQAPYVYPDTFPVNGFGANTHVFDISNLTAGKYHFKVVDTCGNTLFDSITIAPSELSDFSHQIWYKKGCLGQNEIHYTFKTPNGDIRIKNISTSIEWVKNYNTGDYANPINDSLMNLPSGTYAISFTYARYFPTGAPYMNPDTIPCQEITDTIVIEGYFTPVISTNNSILCNNSINMQLIPDSTKGVPPYQYEIIAGPQTFPVQSSNIFTVSLAGTYTARIYDICGNASTASITADTITFPPLIPIEDPCGSIRLFYGAAEYFTYTWTGPNNQLYTGDTLVIDPITPADTGIYQIKRIVNINGCSDTAYSSYRLTFPVTYKQIKTICIGESIRIGDSVYNTTGIFTDTLISINGCDSIVVLDLTVAQFKEDSLTRVICTGQSIIIGVHTYNQTGIYKDTIPTSTCDSIVILNLTVDPSKKDSTTRIICAGQSITSGGNVYNQTGVYRDTMATATCDSIVILNLRVDPIKKDSTTRIICAGQSITSGGNVYNQTGVYRDTMATATCDSIVILNLRVDPPKKDSTTKIICQRQSVTSAGHIYNQTGIYRDTLATATCDSIVVLNLRVDPIKKDSTTKIICAGQSVTSAGNIYTVTGIYRDTLATATCDSIVILNLRVDPLKRDSTSKIICIGQSITSGNHTYSQTGIYRDTVSTATCDSVIILNLRVDPLKRDSTSKIICIGQSVISGNHTYSQTGIYRDTVSTSTCDSVIILNLQVASIKKDSITKVICAGESVTNGSHTYNQTGIYRDTIATATCDSIAILNLQVDPLKKDSTTKMICEGETVTSGGNVYNQTGIYTNRIATTTCDSIITLNLTVNPAPVINITANPLTVDSGAVVQLNTTAAASYLWTSVATLNNNAIQNPEAIITQSSWIYLLATASPGNCTALDSIFIVMRINPCNGSNSYIYMPNAFTPNNDRYNNVFKIYSNNVTLNRFEIFNRWGEVVFETKDINKGWDGMYKGKMLAGNYVYFISYSQCNLKIPKTIKGNIMVIR